MFFHTNDAYENAIRTQNKEQLRFLLAHIIADDPTFATTEFEEALEYIKKESMAIHGQEIKLEEKYVIQEEEETYSQEKNTETFYNLNLLWLQKNFCIQRRLPLIRDLGKQLFSSKPTIGKKKAEAFQAEKKPENIRFSGTISDDASGNTPIKKKGFSITAGIVILVVIIILIMIIQTQD